MAEQLIGDVADTAFWVAHYRAAETERPDAIFLDPLAERLAGDRGRRIAAGMKQSRYTRWTVVTRTHIIDRYILDRIAAGIDTVLNLGAGLDTRPYRLTLPAATRWIEVDYPKIIEFKEQRLDDVAPHCNLERIQLDLADRVARQKLFSKLNGESTRALVITEGVIPYLTPEQVASLADDLLAQPNFGLWIAEYYSPRIYHYLKASRTMNSQMQNAPFEFFPEDWFGFFNEHGWKVKEMRYLAEESQRLGRAVPMPWWATLLRRFVPKERLVASNQFIGFALLER